MVRIDITWGVVSPSMKFCSGMVEIFTLEDDKFTIKKIFQCEVTKEQNRIGYSGFTSPSDPIFYKYRNHIVTIVNSYFKGMNLDKETFNWIEEENLQ